MPDLLPYLNAAAADPELKADVLTFVKGGVAPRIVVEGHTPRVKVERLLTQLFHANPELAIERVHVRARSGCSDFSGELTATTGDAQHRFAFTWCCAWRAEQEGWKDCFGFWDQGRAAREFGWRCFQKWEVVS